MRQVVLDTETTGLDPEAGHRIIEIGCVELNYRRVTDRQFHTYLCPERAIDPGAIDVHGLTDDFLADKPKFGDVAARLLEFIDGAEVVIHNAPFDVGFIDSELALLAHGHGCLADYCTIVDSLVLARELHPGQRNSLDALCRRYEVDDSAREVHGALLDARLLAEVYLAMTGGQAALELGQEPGSRPDRSATLSDADAARFACAQRVVEVDAATLAAHRALLEGIQEESGGRCIWLPPPD